MSTITTWNTAPNYDNWGFDDSWTCEDWIKWHMLLVDHFGKEKAKFIWDYAFAKSGQFSENLNCRTFNSAFRKHIRNYGLDPFANAGVFSVVLEGYGSAADTASGILDGITSFASGNTIKTILNVALIGSVVLGGFYIYNKVKK